MERFFRSLKVALRSATFREWQNHITIYEKSAPFREWDVFFRSLKVALRSATFREWPSFQHRSPLQLRAMGSHRRCPHVVVDSHGTLPGDMHRDHRSALWYFWSNLDLEVVLTGFSHHLRNHYFDFLSYWVEDVLSIVSSDHRCKRFTTFLLAAAWHFNLNSQFSDNLLS